MYYENYTFIHKTLDNRCRPIKMIRSKLYNWTTELPNIQQVCTRVLQIKIVLLCKYFLQGSWWKCSKIFSDQFRFIRSEMFKHTLQAASANATISQTKELPSTREMFLFTPASQLVFVRVQFLSWQVIAFVAIATVYGSSQSFLPLGGVIERGGEGATLRYISEIPQTSSFSPSAAHFFFSKMSHWHRN